MPLGSLRGREVLLAHLTRIRRTVDYILIPASTVCRAVACSEPVVVTGHAARGPATGSSRTATELGLHVIVQDRIGSDRGRLWWRLAVSGVGFGGTTSGVVVTVAGTGSWTALVAVLVTGQRSCRGQFQGLLVDKSSGAQRENTHGSTEYYVIGGFSNQFQLQKNLFQVNGTMAGPH